MSNELITQQQPRLFSAAVLDTLNAVQNKAYIEYMKEKGKPGFDEWRDYGVEILYLFEWCKTWGVEMVLVLGKEGTGKTIGAYSLDPEQTLYMNADNKPFSFPNGNKMYNAEKKNYAVVGTYDKVEALLSKIISDKRIHPSAKGKLTLFVLAHIDVYKNNSTDGERLRVLGKMPTKLGIEGSLTHTYYTWVDPNMSLKDEDRYKLLTRNSGMNTGRTPMGMWNQETESKIPNNFQLILDKIIAER